MSRPKVWVAKIIAPSKYLFDHQIEVFFVVTGVMLGLEFLKFTYRLYGLLGTVATIMIMVPFATGSLMRRYLFRVKEFSKADRRYLTERFIKSSSVLLVGLGLAALMKKQDGPVQPILLASVTALAQWALTAETAAVWLKYRFPERFGE
jgi:hypothetical protein